MTRNSRGWTSYNMRGGTGSGVLAIPLVILFIAIIISINFYYPGFIPSPWGNQINQGVRTVSHTVSEVVTFTLDAAGNLRVTIKNALNITAEIAKSPQINATATVFTKGTRITGAELQATMRILEINFTAPIPNRSLGPDQTLFTWGFPLATLPAGVATLTAEVVLSVIGCGSCSNTTVSVPVDLQMTALAGSAT